jgi:hypothetical protein
MCTVVHEDRYCFMPIRIRIGINMEIRIRVQMGIVGGHDAGRCKVGSTLQ